MFKILSICFCLFFLLSCNTNTNEANLLSAKATRVLSGQTIEVMLTETSKITKVRITGIDAPDLRQSPWGETARERLTELVMGVPISIETDNLKSDRFNRINAHIWQNNTSIGEQLVKEGYVLANMEYPHSYSKIKP